MGKESLVNLIKEKLAEGIDIETIREGLLDAGYLPSEIAKALKVISEEKAVSNEQPFSEARTSDKEIPSPSYGEEIFPSEPKVARKPSSLPKILLAVLLVLMGTASFYLYGKVAGKDPISLLPQETAFYLRAKVSPENQQVKNLKALLEKFPNFETISQKISEEFKKLKEENPPLKNLDFTISDEIVLAWISPFEEETEEVSLVLILPSPDLEKLEKLAKDIRKSIEESEDWKIEEETYKGRTIFKSVPTEESKYRSSPGEPKLEPATVFTNNNFILATKPEDIRKIIDVAESQKITKIFQKDKIKNINSSQAYKKIKKYLPKDYLVLFYGELDWSKVLKTAEKKGAVPETKGRFTPLITSIIATFKLPFFGRKNIEESEKVALASTITALENELKSESYYLDLRKEAFLPSQFSFKDSLAQFVPEEFQGREIAYYIEARDPKSSFEEWEKTSTKEMTAEEKSLFYDFLKSLNEFLGVDFREDIISLFEKNYAYFVASGPSGEEASIIAFLFEIDDGDKIKESLLKIKVPEDISGLLEEGLEGSQSKAKDARVIADMAQIRMVAEMEYISEGGYSNVNCNYRDIEPLCEDIKGQIGSEPIIHQSQNAYCAYVKLNQPGAYYCIDSEFTAMKTYIHPGGIGYCTGKSFLCPTIEGEVLPEEIPPVEKIGFQKETIDGFEVYSLPIFEDLGFNFSIKDKKLIFTFTKKGLIDVLKGLSEPDQKKLRDSEIFAEQFKEVPKKVSGISYAYPYRFLGLAKYGVNFLVDIVGSFVPETGLEADMYSEIIVSAIFEFLDKGVAPYLKILKTSSSYSFSPEEDLIISKQRLVIEQLPVKEKEECEEFWANIEAWLEEKFTPLMMWPGQVVPPVY